MQFEQYSNIKLSMNISKIVQADNPDKIEINNDEVDDSKKKKLTIKQLFIVEQLNFSMKSFSGKRREKKRKKEREKGGSFLNRE